MADTMRGARPTKCAVWPTLCMVRPTQCCGAADVMYVKCGAGRPESVMDPPHMAKNKFLLNEYLGIFMHFESIFLYFFKSGKWTFSDPSTH